MFHDEPTTMIIVRHAETILNSEGRFCGHRESDLSDRAQHQITTLTETLEGEGPFVAAYVSPLTRSHKTIAPYLRKHPIPLTIELGLREKNHGSWEGRLLRDVPHPEGTVFPQAAFDGSTESEDGDSVAFFRKRVESALLRIGERHHGERVLVSTHAGVIWTIAHAFVENPILDPLWWPSNTCLLEVVYQADGTLHLLRS
jgi:broad specificity phosphatase PhoE